MKEKVITMRHRVCFLLRNSKLNSKLIHAISNVQTSLRQRSSPKGNLFESVNIADLIRIALGEHSNGIQMNLTRCIKICVGSRDTVNKARPKQSFKFNKPMDKVVRLTSFIGLNM